MSGNINKLYTYAGKCDYQHHYKAIIEFSIVSTPEIFTNNSPVSHGPSVNVINPSARTLLRIFTEVLDVKKITAVHRLGATK